MRRLIVFPSLSSTLRLFSAFPSKPPADEVDEHGALKRPFGTSKAEDDAEGHTDAFAAVKASLDAAKKARGDDDAHGDGEIPSEDVDHIQSSANRRRNKRKKNMDNVLGDVLADALRLRDMGKKPDMDFVYKQTQERVFEAEHGRKPPSSKDRDARYVPFPPDMQMTRLLPNTLFEDDPWPERSITPENPVLTTHEVEEDKHLNKGRRVKEQEKMFEPKEGRDVLAEFADAVDELTHWEFLFLDFVRDIPLTQRRTLPLLHEHYRAVTHRLIRAERRFINIRNAAMSACKAPQSAFELTEQRIERTRALYSETHKSLSSPNYDPKKMKKSSIGPLMSMSRAQYGAWKEEERRQRNVLIAEFSTNAES